mmetsp:Transcript_43390/g.112877  ORF Transcript_43390/g.112877 Transcript_43390/m.112877 type:complete len:282 (+) Transcript_43390:410-1255(+)
MVARNWLNKRYPKPQNTFEQENGLRLPSHRDPRSEEQKSIDDTWSRIVYPFGGLSKPKHWIADGRYFNDWDKGATKTWGPQITVGDLPMDAEEWHNSRQTIEPQDGEQKLIVAPGNFNVPEVGQDSAINYYNEERSMCPVMEKPKALDVPLEEVAPHFYTLPFYTNGKKIQGSYQDVQALRETRGAMNQHSIRHIPIRFGNGAKLRLEAVTFNSNIYKLRGSKLTRPRRPEEQAIVNPNVVIGNELESRKYGIAKIMRGQNIALYPSSKYTGIARKEEAYE